MHVLFVFLCVVAAVAADGWQCPPGSKQCETEGGPGDEQFFRINGSRVVCGWNGRQYAWLECGGRALDDPALPAMARATTVRRAKLRRCAPPAASYANALAAINLTTVDMLTIETDAAAVLTRQHFTKLYPDLTLDLTGTPDLRAEDDFLIDSQLGSLRLENVTVTGRMLEFLPAGLRALSLKSTNVTVISTAAVTRLVNLSSLMVRESGQLEIDLSNSSVKRVLVQAGVRGMPIGPRVIIASFSYLRGLDLLGACTSLERLEVSSSFGGELRLEQCLNLEVLKVSETPVAIQKRGIKGLKKLTELSLRNCSLQTLPADLRELSALKVLDVSSNKLRELPDLPASLKSVDASRNQLIPGAAQSLARYCPKLEKLYLSYNPLGDACGEKTDASFATNDVSHWSRLSRLSSLHLRHTGVTRLCADWRRAQQLVYVDLSYNNITDLTYYDMQWFRSTNSTTVDLSGNPLTSIHYSHGQYNEALQRTPPAIQLTSLLLPPRSRCDCSWYWYRAALQHSPRHAANISSVVCNEESAPEVRKKTLQSVNPNFLSCPLYNVSCPDNCRCVEAGAARVICRNGDIGRVPTLGGDLWQYAVEMRLPGNAIEEVEVDSLPPKLELLDLSNNSISILPDDVTAALSRVNISISNNPLECACAGKTFIKYLFANRDRVLDFDSATCSDGTLLSTILISDLCPALSTGTLATIIISCLFLSALFALGMILAAWKWLPDRLQRKLAFIARPFNFTIADDKEYTYDLFVSHAHGDWKIGKEVATIAEDAGMRACVHWRDWPLGGIISKQIASSVCSSRKTAILLSPRYLESQWARMELAAALGDPQRVLIIMVEASTAVPEELAVFVSTHTYLDWRDSRFKEKLLEALQPHKKIKSQHKKIPVGEPLDVDKVDPPTSDNDIKIMMNDIVAENNSERSNNSQTALVA